MGWRFSDASLNPTPMPSKTSEVYITIRLACEAAPSVPSTKNYDLPLQHDNVKLKSYNNFQNQNMLFFALSVEFFKIYSFIFCFCSFSVSFVHFVLIVLSKWKCVCDNGPTVVNLTIGYETVMNEREYKVHCYLMGFFVCFFFIAFLHFLGTIWQ